MSSVIDAEQLDAALRQQVIYGGRLGTNLFELGYATSDQIAHGLARLHQVPAALERHLERHDPALVALVSRELAGAHTVFPIAYALAPSRCLVLGMRDPHDRRAADAVRAATGLEVIPSVAPELSIYGWLERCYAIPRSRRFAHARPGHSAPLPHTTSASHPVAEAAAAPTEPVDESVDVELDFDEIEMPAEMQLVELDHSDVERDFTQYDVRSGQHGSLIELAQLAREAERAAAPSARMTPTAAAAAAVAAAAAAVAVPPCPPAPSPPALSAPTPIARTPATLPRHPTGPVVVSRPLTAKEAIAAIDLADHRSEVSDAVVAYMGKTFGGGLILLVKESLALGYRGFGGVFDASSVESIVVPLSLPSMFQIVAERGVTFVGPPPAEGYAIQDRFFKLFPLAGPPAEVAVVPVAIGQRLVCLYYGHAGDGGPLAMTSVTELDQIARTAERAFVRLIRQTKRPHGRSKG